MEEGIITEDVGTGSWEKNMRLSKDKGRLGYSKKEVIDIYGYPHRWA